jgi:hypothetical protein
MRRNFNRDACKNDHPVGALDIEPSPADLAQDEDAGSVAVMLATFPERR